MVQNILEGVIPRGSMGLKLLLVCALVLVMTVPLMLVGGLVSERQQRANEVTAEIGSRAGGAQVVGGSMLLVPYSRIIETQDSQGATQRRTERSYYLIFPETGSASTTLDVEDRRRGIYRAATYTAATDLSARFRPMDALRNLDPSVTLDWTAARFVMFVTDSRNVRDAAELRFPDGTTATLEPLSGLTVASSGANTNAGQFFEPFQGVQAFVAPAPFSTPPEEYSVETRLVLGGAQRFAVAAFAQDTSITMRGDRRDVSAEGYFQTNDPVRPGQNGFSVAWRVPFVARGLEQVADLNQFQITNLAGRDMAVSFVAADDIYNGVMRAVRYAIMFIGIVFLATLVFEAIGGKKAHPAQYILVGLAQCVFYLLLLSLTELIGFTVAFAIAAAATVALLSYYAAASFKSAAVGIKAFLALGVLYGAMYVLMTLEDFAMLAGSLVAFAVIAATMIATRRIDWYGRRVIPAEG